MVKLYHTAPALYADQFREGAVATRSDGNGQGNGFYVWTNVDLAKNHVKRVQEHDCPENDKRTIILEVEVDKLDEREWDLDHERHTTLSSQTLADNFHLLKRLPKQSIKLARGYLDTEKSRVEDAGSFRSMRFVYHNGVNTGTYTLMAGSPEGDLSSGKTLGRTFNALLEHFPEETLAIRREWLKDPNQLDALKYTGQTPLEVKIVEQN